jgi:hypothetical protein
MPVGAGVPTVQCRICHKMNFRMQSKQKIFVSSVGAKEEQMSVVVGEATTSTEDNLRRQNATLCYIKLYMRIRVRFFSRECGICREGSKNYRKL